MGSAPQESAGTASGINNAVARVARVLAIAIFGAIALVTFQTALATRTAELDLGNEVRAALDVEAMQLGAASAPEGLSEQTTQQVTNALHWSFVETFRLLAGISAGLAWVSAVLAWLFVDGREKAKGTPISNQT